MPVLKRPIESIARKQFGRRIRILRKARQLTKSDVAHLSGLDRGYVGSLERGVRNPSLDTIARIARALNVSIAQLFSR